MELRAGYFISSSHIYLTGILRSKCIMGKMPGIPLCPKNQSRACSQAPKASSVTHPVFPDLSPSPFHNLFPDPVPILHPSRPNPNAASQDSIPDCTCGEGPWSTWLRLIQGDFTLRLPWGWPVCAPGCIDGKVLGVSVPWH